MLFRLFFLVLRWSIGAHRIALRERSDAEWGSITPPEDLKARSRDAGRG